MNTSGAEKIEASFKRWGVDIHGNRQEEVSPPEEDSGESEMIVVEQDPPKEHPERRDAEVIIGEIAVKA